MTNLDVIPGNDGTAILVDSATGARFVLDRTNSVALAHRLLSAAASPARIVANAQPPAPPVPPPPPPPFVPGPVDPNLAATNAMLAYLEELKKRPYVPPQPPPAPQPSGGSTTIGGDSRR